MDPSTSSSLQAVEITERTEHLHKIADDRCRIIVFNHQQEVARVNDVVFFYQTSRGLVIDVVKMKADIGRKPLPMWNLIQADIQTIELSSLRMLASKIKQPQPEFSSSATSLESKTDPDPTLFPSPHQQL